MSYTTKILNALYLCEVALARDKQLHGLCSKAFERLQRMVVIDNTLPSRVRAQYVPNHHKGLDVILINSQFYEYCKSEVTLAAVLMHEVAHATLFHSNTIFADTARGSWDEIINRLRAVPIIFPDISVSIETFGKGKCGEHVLLRDHEVSILCTLEITSDSLNYIHQDKKACIHSYFPFTRNNNNENAFYELVTHTICEMVATAVASSLSNPMESETFYGLQDLVTLPCKYSEKLPSYICRDGIDYVKAIHGSNVMGEQEIEISKLIAYYSLGFFSLPRVVPCHGNMIPYDYIQATRLYGNVRGAGLIRNSMADNNYLGDLKMIINDLKEKILSPHCYVTFVDIDGRVVMNRIRGDRVLSVDRHLFEVFGDKPVVKVQELPSPTGKIELVISLEVK